MIGQRWENGPVASSSLNTLVNTASFLDKLYITHSEWSSEYGGAKAASKKTNDSEHFQALPFDHCSLTLAPFETPVCAPEGTVFDLLHIVPYLQRHGKNPVTGEPLAVDQLVRLYYSRNGAGEFHCPITLKTFTDYSHIVANRKSGNVYSVEGIVSLMTKDGRYRDYFTEQPFTKDDLITLQDPTEREGRNMAMFLHIRQQKLESQGKMMEKEKIKERPIVKEAKDDNEDTVKSVKMHSQPSMSAPASTSTAFTPTPGLLTAPAEDSLARLFSVIKGSGKATIRTNYGDLHIELYCSRTPQTCYNFITLARRGYYANTRAHRLIAGFMLQAGDPTGSGAGGSSCWGRPFGNEIVKGLSHDRRGVLSMANKGLGTRSNTSQFFITFDEAKHLDGIHPIFGQVIAGMSVLDQIESIPVDAYSRPTKPIIIEDIIVVEDPFQEHLDREKQTEFKKRTRAQVDPTILDKKAKSISNTPTTIGRYIKKPQ